MTVDSTGQTFQVLTEDQIRVLYTGRDGSLCQFLRGCGLKVTSKQVLSFRPIDSGLTQLENLLERYPDAWLIVTSITAARLLKNLGVKFRSHPVASTGPATATALTEAGFNVQIVAPQPSSAATLAPKLAELSATKILWATSNLASDWLGTQLSAQGHCLTRINIYQTLPNFEAASFVAENWFDWQVKIFSSPSSVDVLAGQVDLAKSVGLVALGNTTMKRLQDFGANPVCATATDGCGVLAAVQKAHNRFV